MAKARALGLVSALASASLVMEEAFADGPFQFSPFSPAQQAEPAPPPATPPKEETRVRNDNPRTTAAGFDPEALERGAVALREINKSRDAKKVFELMRKREETRQAELTAKKAEFQAMQAQYETVQIAQAYEAGGAACLSVLTDEKYFQGSFDNLEAIRNAGVKVLFRVPPCPVCSAARSTSHPLRRTDSLGPPPRRTDTTTGGRWRFSVHRTLDLSNSQLKGEIAPQISKLTLLKTLNLSRNNLKGPVPAFLLDLQNLFNIDLSNNDLSGSIPPGLQEKNKSGLIVLSVDGNPRICQGYQCDQDKKGRKKIIVISVVVSLVVATLIFSLGITVIKRRKQDKMEEGGRPTDNIEMADSLPRRHASLVYGKSSTFTYSEVVEMTNNFEKVIGRGGSGTVFYGRLKDGHEVAVKKLSSRLVERGTKEFAAEVKMLMQVHHKHLTPLVGYCDDEKELVLIYEYMSNGNLHKQLSDETADALNWLQRLHIALDAATGLEYLHSGCKPAVIHRDVKSSNILINENFKAKISDFGLSKSVVSDEITHITTAVAGTAGYLDPEYCCTYKVTEKSDVFGFGVVLFELITGRTAISTNVEGERVPLVQLVLPELKRGNIRSIIDPRLHGQYNICSIQIVAETAMTCTEEKSIARPTMTEVVAQLKEAMEIETSRERSGSGRMEASSTSSLPFSKTSSATAMSDTDSSFYPSAR